MSITSDAARALTDEDKLWIKVQLEAFETRLRTEFQAATKSEAARALIAAPELVVGTAVGTETS